MAQALLSVNAFRRAGRRAATIRTPARTGEGGFMLWTIVVILVILWLLGALGTVSIPVLSGNTVHVLLVIVVIIVAIQLLQGRRL
jgi:F0F1-type ATP synthase assembly protein I